MTFEERLQACQVCANRKFSTKVGLICGWTGEKPSFEGACGDYAEDAEAVAAVASRKKQAEEPGKIKGLLAFFLYFSIPVGIIVTLVSFLMNYNAEVYGGYFCFRAFDFVYLAFYLYFSIYTIFAFHKRRPDAVFLAKYLLISLFLSNLFVLLIGTTGNSFLNNAGRLTGSLIWSAVFFLYLCISPDVEERIPRKTRKIAGMNKILFILSIVLPILLMFGGFVEIIGKSGRFASGEKLIEQVCADKSIFPMEFGDSLSVTDIYTSGKTVTYCYKMLKADADDYTDSELEMMRIIGREDILRDLPSYTTVKGLFRTIAQTGYDVTWLYTDQYGEELYSISVPRALMAASMDPDYHYSTPTETMVELADLFSTTLPVYLTPDCSARRVFFSDDILHYELMLHGMTPSGLALMTPSYLKEYSAACLPSMNDALLKMACINGKTVSFDFRGDSDSQWTHSTMFTAEELEGTLFPAGE